MKIKVTEAPPLAIDWAVAVLQGVRGEDLKAVIRPGEEKASYLNLMLRDSDGELSGTFTMATSYSTDRSAGWKIWRILDEKGISIIRVNDEFGADSRGYCNNVRIPVWAATTGQHGLQTSTDHQSHEPMFQIDGDSVTYGPTPIIAAMRCYLRSEIGEVIDVPDEVLAGYENLRISQPEVMRPRG